VLPITASAFVLFSPQTIWWPCNFIRKKVAAPVYKSCAISAAGGEMLSKRIIPCLDVRDGKLTKGIKFEGNVDIGDPVEAARGYYEQGADEIVFYDITASADGRDIMIDVVRRVAETIFIPFSVGGGIRNLEDMHRVILAGAEKVSVNSTAVTDPKIITQGAQAFGSQCIVLGMDVRKVEMSGKIPSGYEIVINGGRKYTGIDALWWAKEAEILGAGEICLNSIDADGTQNGYELNLTALISENVNIPVIASGGAGKPEHLAEVLTEGKADAALIASMVHYRTYTIAGIKQYLNEHQIKTRLYW
jgi:cyclase